MSVEMNGNGTDKDAVLARLPSSTDSDEVRITQALESELLRTSWAKDFFSIAKTKQIEFFRNALSNLQNPREIYQNAQTLIQELSTLGKSHIVEGQENLEDLHAPAFIVSNHLGDYKLATIKPEELGLQLDTDQIHPFPMYYSPYHPIGKLIGADLGDAHVQLLPPLYDVEKASGLVTIIAGVPNGVTRLEKETREVLEQHPNLLMVVFPEGGTSGKRNGGGPYDLEKFKTGAFVIAANLGIPALPVAKYFDPREGYKLRVFPAVNLNAMPDSTQARTYYEEQANRTQTEIQEWLNQQIAAV